MDQQQHQHDQELHTGVRCYRFSFGDGDPVKRFREFQSIIRERNRLEEMREFGEDSGSVRQQTPSDSEESLRHQMSTVLSEKNSLHGCVMGAQRVHYVRKIVLFDCAECIMTLGKFMGKVYLYMYKI